MRYTIRIFLLVSVCFLVGAYFVEQRVVRVQHQLYNHRDDITDSRHTMHLLQAEWAMLTRPQYLSKLAKKHGLQPLQGEQMVTPDALPQPYYGEYTYGLKEVPMEDLSTEDDDEQ